jgi:hypothetical protein
MDAYKQDDERLAVYRCPCGLSTARMEKPRDRSKLETCPSCLAETLSVKYAPSKLDDEPGAFGTALAGMLILAVVVGIAFGVFNTSWSGNTTYASIIDTHCQQYSGETVATCNREATVIFEDCAAAAKLDGIALADAGCDDKATDWSPDHR